jgi:cysteinyl-tRNA synthetase
MHCGILTVNHKKMSKSTGNFHTLREVAECFPYDVIRFFLVSGHYRMPMEYGTHLLESAAQALTRIKNCRDSIVPSKESRPGNETEPAADATVNFSKLTLPEEAKTFRRAFEAAMDDDFNTADAMAAIFEMVKYINTSKPRELETAMALRDELDFLCGLLGIRFEETAQKLDADIEALISLRQEARANKNWAEADRIRDELLARGIALKDTPGGVQWTRK